MQLKHGELYVIEGLDGCGKETQTKLLLNRLKECGEKVKLISFPNYNAESSSLVKAYLHGDFGNDAEAISPYQVSAFYAVDRVTTYLLEMKDFLEENGTIICDRYVTSNIVYQSTKITDLEEREKFVTWLKDFEYDKLGLPIPTKTFFLNVSSKTFLNSIKNRNNNKHSGKDIHEENLNYLMHIYNTSCEIANKNNWVSIKCDDGDGQFLSREVISNNIFDNF